MALEDICKEYFAFEAVDKSEFQRKARLLQSIWREEQGYEIGIHKGRNIERPLGSRLAMPFAKDNLANYLSDNIKAVVRDEVFNSGKSQGKLYGKPRIFNDLLSSQPLCFNLFAELKLDLELASKVFSDLTEGKIAKITRIEFEHSPARGSDCYSGDNSAFDVYVEYINSENLSGFLGIEVKYHENLMNEASKHKPRYEEISEAIGYFNLSEIDKLKRKPLQQVWRDHLLACSMLLNKDFEDGAFVYLYPKDNPHCSQAVSDYRSCLTDSTTFVNWHIEDVAKSIMQNSDKGWINVFWDRYLAFEKIPN